MSVGQCISDWPENTCTTFRGGQYDANASRTYIEANSSIAAFDSTPNVTTQSLWAKDSLTFNSNLTLENFPLGIPRVDWGGFYDPQMVLGMGPNSTILNALKAAGKVSSRTWSFFWGLTGATPNVQMPGSFVLGGYDRAKVTGNNHTQALSSLKPTCKTGMLVTIVDMQLNFPNGTSPSLFNGTLSAAMSACIQPDFPVIMTMPYDPYYAYFMELAGGTFLGRSLGVNYYGMNYAPQDVYDGDLTIVLDSGLSVRIPNHVLVNPDLIVNKTNGHLYINDSSLEVLINSQQTINANDLPIIGRQFFSAAYVMLNQDSNEFTLWAANPTTDEDLVAVDENNQVVEQFCAPGSGNTTQTPTNITSPQSASKPSATASPDKASRGLSGGAIAGIVVGSLAGIAAIAASTYYFCMRQDRDGMPTAAAAAAAAAQDRSYVPPPSYSPLAPVEMENKYVQPYTGPVEMYAGDVPPPAGRRPPSRRAAPGTYELADNQI
ncbi:hypothetical protein T310_8237 [Rasamsonia emersonii CBS 393.64]|uniref:Peptidase A1 domain-containing protein n=1 Tax=Rasamsonia emersonii (strain ATCC 16479 / CBS 393.64 / IMI 116815) TaxID=1408163 RepID=A0A0F4YI83_RASE3|nr:hypothetical protein T310_8237 [Rasamsonia emersonii CBS 393.64]KKA17825.1 hypothetical protein T310_8237 [Rasamsonia emersonii CBS 393.64]